ncbi:hypothetical protein T459_28242 [Capsicum annuum]|uniref:Uncharacterized protein n=1 Tax=Capsicum annuum TaxID=4072 RepID=A0A2G2YGA5_CAPAN|nr:hypothetical protein T459_28242 [Capsicum annuum]
MSDSWFVASLILVNETYENVELASLVDGNNDWELGTSGGNLCVFCDCHEVRMDVWVIKTYELVESWTKVEAFSKGPVTLAETQEILRS